MFEPHGRRSRGVRVVDTPLSLSGSCSLSVLDDLDAAELCCPSLTPAFVAPPRYLPQPKLGEFIASKCTLLPDSVRIALESTATRMSKCRGEWVFDVAMLSVAWASLLFRSVGCTPPNS